MLQRKFISNVLKVVVIAVFLLTTIEAGDFPFSITATVEKPNTKIQPSFCKSEEQIKNGLTLLEATQCAKIEKNSGGKDFPWLAMLMYSDGISLTAGCDGSLITDRYVLTTAECLLSKDKILVSVRFGETNQGYTQEIDVEEAIYHRDHHMKLSTYFNDIGLVRLRSKVVLGDTLTLVCLPMTTQSKAVTLERLIITSWKKIENGHKVKELVPVMNHTTCEDIHLFLDLTEKHLCIGEEGSLNNYCSGNSGSPMVLSATIDRETRYIQYGIVSLDGQFCGSSLPSYFMRVEPYLSWIAGNIVP